MYRTTLDIFIPCFYLAVPENAERCENSVEIIELK